MGGRRPKFTEQRSLESYLFSSKAARLWKRHATREIVIRFIGAAVAFPADDSVTSSDLFSRARTTSTRGLCRSRGGSLSHQRSPNRNRRLFTVEVGLDTNDMVQATVFERDRAHRSLGLTPAVEQQSRRYVGRVIRTHRFYGLFKLRPYLKRSGPPIPRSHVRRRAAVVM